MTDHPSSAGPVPEHPDADPTHIAALLRAVPPDHDTQLAAFALLCAYRREALSGVAAEPNPHGHERAVARARLQAILGSPDAGRQSGPPGGRPRNPLESRRARGYKDREASEGRGGRMTAEFDEDEVVVRAARRAVEQGCAGPPAAADPTGQAARAWWAVVDSGPAGAVCERWFDACFRLTCHHYPSFRDRRDEFWQAAQLDLVRRLAARVRDEGGVDAVTGRGFGAWVRQQFDRCCCNLARREVRRGKRLTVDAGPDDWGTVPDHRSGAPDWQVDGLAAALQDCLARLPMEQRVVVGLMVESPGITYRGIASRLGGLSIGTVYNRFHAARDQLKNCLAAKGIE